MKFNKTNSYEQEIKSYVKKILLLCERERIPAFFTFAIKNEGKDTDYITEMISATSVDVSLKNDKIARHALITAGFDAVPKKEQQ